MVGLLIVFLILAVPVRAVELGGYVESGLSARSDDSGPIDDRLLMGETRLLLEKQWYGRQGEMADVRAVAVQNYSGKAEVEVRTASLFVPLSPNLELEIGRQILSWGPARYEFVNDRFAKDYDSFFLGRDLEFLKAPNDALRTRYYPGNWTVDLALMPKFQEDRLPNPDKFPVLDPGTGNPVKFRPDSGPFPIKPREAFEDGEAHLRLFRMFGSWETALYGFRGFSGRPEAVVRGFEGDTRAYYPEISAGGVSLRGPALGGILWMEAAYEDVREDRAGETPDVPADHWTGLLGVEFDPTPNRTLMFQGMAITEIDSLEAREQLEQTDPDHPRIHRTRWRLQGAWKETMFSNRLNLTARGFWGITEEDLHLRFSTGYEWSDKLHFNGALHLFTANHPASRFGLLENYDLVSFRTTYYF